MEDNRIYIFLSHSHHDYEKVRKVRDLLENEGFRPLMFFLKCLERVEYKELTEKLIKEEIDSRQRFILCESDNTKESNWVKFEIEHIQKRKRPYAIVDLNGTDEEIQNVIKTFKRRSSVFLSYSRNLFSLVKATSEELKQCDFLPFFDHESIVSGGDYMKQIKYSIKNAAKKGYVLAFIDEKMSEFQYKEIQMALESKGSIIPIITTNNLPTMVKCLLGPYVKIDVSNMSVKEAARCIAERLIEIDLERFTK